MVPVLCRVASKTSLMTDPVAATVILEIEAATVILEARVHTVLTRKRGYMCIYRIVLLINIRPIFLLKFRKSFPIV